MSLFGKMPFKMLITTRRAGVIDWRQERVTNICKTYINKSKQKQNNSSVKNDFLYRLNLIINFQLLPHLQLVDSISSVKQSLFQFQVNFEATYKSQILNILGPQTPQNRWVLWFLISKGCFLTPWFCFRQFMAGSREIVIRKVLQCKGDMKISFTFIITYIYVF